MLNRVVLVCVLAIAACAPVAGSSAPPATPAVAQSSDPSASEWYLDVPAAIGPAGPADQPTKCQLYVYELGQGPPLVILHGGFGADHSYLLTAFEPLARRRRLVFFDQRGSLRSPCPAPALLYDALVEDVERLRVALDVPRVDVVGHSMGSVLAMSYLLAHPDRVGHIVLTGALPPYLKEVPRSQEVIDRMTKRPEVEAVKARRRAEQPARSLATDLWRIDFASVNLWHVERWRSMRGGKVFYNGAAGQALLRSTPDVIDARDALRKHPYPITYLQGDVDYCDPSSTLSKQQLSPAPPHIRFVVLANAGHAAWIDDPAGYQRALDAALPASAAPSSPPPTSNE